MRFIGDVHGKYERYKKLIREVPASIQVGDMGIGFYKIVGDERVPSQNPPFNAMAKGNHRFIRGNHDNPNACRNNKFWIKDGHVEGDMMFVGGAQSVDRHLRTEGLSWWADEEINYNDMCYIYDTYEDTMPRIMVTHDCPLLVYEHLVTYKSDLVHFGTAKYFNEFHRTHKPEIWIFGHHHKSFDQVIDGTRFICLAELECLDLEI